MAFVVKALILSNFLAFFSNFVFDIEKFYQVLSTCQISDQLDDSNRNYRGGEGEGTESDLPRQYQSAKSLACLGLMEFSNETLMEFFENSIKTSLTHQNFR